MNVQALKSLIELQAMQNFSNSKPADTQASSGTSVFQQMLNETLSSHMHLPQYQNRLGAVNQLNSMLNSHSLATKSAASYITQTASVTPPTNTDSSIEEIISRAAESYNLPKKLISAVISQESNFNPDAVSHAGASGLMQLMPSTARWLGVTDIFDPEQNIFAGTKYLRQMMDKYEGNLEMALAAYNAGPGNVDKYNGIPPFKETIQYVQKVSQRFYA